jgi:hypothetical protein
VVITRLLNRDYNITTSFFARKTLFINQAGGWTNSCTIEFSQLYHAPWIDRVRQTVFGRLVLGSDFAWLDMGAYLAARRIGANTSETAGKPRGIRW